MRKAEVFRNGERAGTITEDHRRHFSFVYDDDYFYDPKKPDLSLTLPKKKKEYHSDQLFPFFFNMLSEGANRKLQSRVLKIDENDHFGFLLATARGDTVGAITVKPLEEWGRR